MGSHRLTPPTPPHGLWQRIYGGAHRLRYRWYRERARHLPSPVISIGNLHWGGSGKTPLTAAIAEHLRDAGHSVAILSRGYASRGRGVRIASTGSGPLLATADIGDEPALLARELSGVAVVVGPDRHAAGTFAIKRLAPAPSVFVLDDGFSHLALYRDLDLLAFPAADPFAGGRLAPSGRLREPLASASRAQAALLTGDATTDDAQALEEALRVFGFKGQAFACPTRLGRPYLLPSKEPLPPNTSVFLASAIARPQGFRQAAESLGLAIRGEIAFADHHAYPPASLERIGAAFRASGAEVVLATAKDAVKLEGRLALPMAVLPIRAEPEGRFWTWLDAAMTSLALRRDLGAP